MKGAAERGKENQSCLNKEAMTNRFQGLGYFNPETEDIMDAIRRDYKTLGIDKFTTLPEKRPNELTVDQSDRLDPNPSPDERAFWGSPLGIDGWQPDFTKHPYPVARVPWADFPEGHPFHIEDREKAKLMGSVSWADVPPWRFYASNLTDNEAAHLKYRMDNLCPAHELKTIAENCMSTPAYKADPSTCWWEKSLFMSCNELKKKYLNNRIRLMYIYGSLRWDLLAFPREPNPPNPLHLYVFRWEFYRLQYPEGKRNIYKRQLKAHQAPSATSFWSRLITPSSWLSSPPPAPHAPKHVKNYVYHGQHWLTRADIVDGPPMTPEEREGTVFDISEDDLPLQDVYKMLGS